MKTHRVADGVLFELWQRAPAPIAIGDTFAVTAGCDKRFSTCRDRFANGVNFRCTAEEYNGYARGVAMSIDAINVQLLDRALTLHPELRTRIEADLAKFGRII